MRNKLIEIRRAKGFSQEEMADKLNIARTTYTGYENGNFAPSLEIALQIKMLLDYEKDDIFLNFNVSKTNKKKKWTKSKNRNSHSTQQIN